MRVPRDAGNPRESLRHYQRAEELWRKSLGVSSPRYAEVLDQIGGTLGDLGRTREGMKYVERGLELRRAILRPEHPDIADSLQRLGVTYMLLGLFRKGLALVQQAVEIRVQELGPEHAVTTHALQTIAEADVYLGDFGRALERFANLLSVRERVLDPHDRHLTSMYLHMGEAQWLAGLSDQAVGTFRQLIEHEAQAGMPDGLGTGYALTFLGRVHNSRRQYRQALRECGRGLELLSRQLDLDSVRLVDTRECIGEALIAAGEFAHARKELERAVLSIADGDLGPHWTAGVRFQLARALWATPADRSRARELAKATLNELAGAEGDNRKIMARIEKWLWSVENARSPGAVSLPANGVRPFAP